MRGVDDPGYEGPRFIRIGATGVLYRKEDLDRWLDQWLAGPSTRHMRVLSLRWQEREVSCVATEVSFVEAADPGALRAHPEANRRRLDTQGMA
jgi:hypothetical protein